MVQVILYNSIGIELDRKVVADMDSVMDAISQWPVEEGDQIQVEGV